MIILAVLMTGAFLSCRSYFKVNSSVPSSAEAVGNLREAGKTIVFHFEEKKWQLTDIQIADSAITGRPEWYDKAPTLRPVRVDRPNKYLTGKNFNQSYLLNEVHLYAGEYALLPGGKVSIPIAAVTRMDLYDKDTQTTVGHYVFTGLGVSAAIFGGFYLIYILTKESCPFVYVRNGEAFQFAGEIYSGSIHPPLERDDYLRLPGSGDARQCTLKISNEVKEVQHTNLLELLVAGHPDGTELLPDKYGNLHLLSDPVLPVSACNLEGKNVKEELAARDGHVYISDPSGSEFPLKDGVLLTFPNKSGAASVKVHLRAKNSIIFDYVMGEFHDLFGSLYPRYMQKQQRAPAARLREMALKRGLPLSLSVERGGDWEYVDYFNISGPMALKEDILEIPLHGDEGDSLKIKLESAMFLWEIDYAALDFSPAAEVVSATVPLAAAIDENGKDVAPLLLHDDALYYIQPEIGNQAVVTFDLPGSSLPERTLILHSKGWYRILRDPQGKPDKRELQAFREPEHFNRFINSRMREFGKVWSGNGISGNGGAVSRPQQP